MTGTNAWSSGCVIAPYYGKLAPDKIFTPGTPEAGGPAAATDSAANPAGNGGSSTSTRPWPISMMQA